MDCVQADRFIHACGPVPDWLFASVAVAFVLYWAWKLIRS